MNKESQKVSKNKIEYNLEIKINDIIKYLPREKNEPELHYIKRCEDVYKYTQKKKIKKNLIGVLDMSTASYYSEKSNCETDAMYENRIKNIAFDSIKFRTIQKAEEIYDIKHEKAKGFVRHIRNFFIKTGGSILSVGAFYGGLVGIMKIKIATVDTGLDDPVYHQNKNIEPGYYVNHPISVGISNDFNWYCQKSLIRAVEEFDEKAEGLRFTISVVDASKLKDYTIKFEPGVYDGKVEDGCNVLGWTYKASNDAKSLEGSIYIDQTKIALTGKKSIGMHELGHKLGLDHNPHPSSLMFPYAINYSLSQEDIDDINTIYPAKKSSTTSNVNSVNKQAIAYLPKNKKYSSSSNENELEK